MTFYFVNNTYKAEAFSFLNDSVLKSLDEQKNVEKDKGAESEVSQPDWDEEHLMQESGLSEK